MLGDNEVMQEFDDFLPPNDAYVHDQLTSGNFGYDHFGNLVRKQLGRKMWLLSRMVYNILVGPMSFYLFYSGTFIKGE